MLAILAYCRILVWLGGFCEARSEGKAARYENQFAQIRCMLLAYHDEHGHFPPITYRLNDHSPVHSWRVLLVPNTDVDYKKRYSSYDFSKEWNSPENRKALGNMPYFYYYSMDDNNEITNYVAVGDNDQWPDDKPLCSRLITSGPDRFLSSCSVPIPDIRWMEPRD